MEGVDGHQTVTRPAGTRKRRSWGSVNMVNASAFVQIVKIIINRNNTSFPYLIIKGKESSISSDNLLIICLINIIRVLLHCIMCMQGFRVALL